jgi:hypothetical protein
VKSKRLGQALLLTMVLLLATFLTLLRVAQYTQAQGEITLTKTLNRTSNVVRVGEVLSFTINLVNNASFTLTHVTLVDEYENTVLGFAGAIPAPDSHDAAAGAIIWDNVASPNPIAPNASLTFTVFFTAEHPRTSVVNAVRAQDITGTMGSLSFVTNTEQIDEAIGGAAPVVKYLSPPDTIPLAGLPITFTHIITNDGAAIMTRLPLTDTYDSAFLEFNYALPFTPNIVSPPGTLVWTNLASTSYFGPIPPDSSVIITTVFTATTQVVNTVNRASTEGALDQFNNDLAAGSDAVPITVIGDTPSDGSDGDDENHNGSSNKEEEEEEEEEEAVPTATPASPATPRAETEVITDVNGPLYLPETGQLSINWIFILLTGLSLLGLGSYLVKQRMI